SRADDADISVLLVSTAGPAASVASFDNAPGSRSSVAGCSAACASVTAIASAEASRGKVMRTKTLMTLLMVGSFGGRVTSLGTSRRGADPFPQLAHPAIDLRIRRVGQ